MKDRGLELRAERRHLRNDRARKRPTGVQELVAYGHGMIVHLLVDLDVDVRESGHRMIEELAAFLSTRARGESA